MCAVQFLTRIFLYGKLILVVFIQNEKSGVDCYEKSIKEFNYYCRIDNKHF